ncbi:MAG: PqqD family peptide modification chaperone [Planctomycetota bacterium]
MAKFLDQSQGSASQTFSDVWFRVAASCPRVSPHARFVRQRQGSSVRYVIEDPTSGSYYRLSEAARYFVGMLDGKRTAESAWRACLAQLGDEAPTQRECLDLLAQLQLYGLLAGDQPLAPDMIAERQHRFRQNRVKKRTGNWLFYHIPLVNPEPILHPLRAVLKVVWGWLGLAVFVGLAFWALFELISNAERIGSDLNGVLSPANVVWLGVAFMGIRALHELGHATACKAMGGRCTEIGVMLIAVVLPLPYCDATSSWRFPETWRRVLVAMGGILIELALASAATIVWAYSEPGTLRTTAFNIMVISGITTFVFNLNPLLRYDGYYVLSDLTGSPNLASRAKELWKHFVFTKLFGIVGDKPPPVRDRGEARFLLLFHACAFPYRITVVTAILLIILGQFLTLGIVLAVVFTFVWLVLPLLKSSWFLITHPKLAGRRSRAIGATLLVLIPPIGVLALVPLPASARVPAVVDWEGLRALRAEANGYLATVHIRPGETVSAGEPVLTFENRTLMSERDAAAARLRRAEAVLDAAAADVPAKRRVARTNVGIARETLADLDRRVAGLTLSAPVAGRVVSPRSSAHDVEQGVGRFVRQGEVLAFILPDSGPTLLAAAPDDVAQRLMPQVRPQHTRATARMRGSAGREIDAVVTRVWPAGTRELPTTALAASTGGEILQDPQDPRRTISPITQIELKPAETEGLLHGRRGRVRIALPAETIASRLLRHMRALVDARLGR